jgi:quinol monooxygenase YgiN
MISVLATIRIKEGQRAKFLDIVRANAVKVREEQGCIEYLPCIDLVGALPGQEIDENLVTIIEKWSDPAALHAHLQSPYMQAYKEQTGDMIENRSIRVLQEG